ncbi:MAG: pyridoxamine 5'-phosphate oxidase family protein [Clostridiales bacterium]|jgi:general stress protein 26|nr:pyridoxamine 5'-phosphate oxidase family protein [Clostridiales bacterium]
MNKYETAMKILEDCHGSGKDNLIALATMTLPDGEGKTRSTVRMVDAYYEDGAFYVSTYAKGNKARQIERNDEVSVASTDWFTGQGKAVNLGWVKDEKNADILAKMKKNFAGWFNDHGNEDSPDSIAIKITLTNGVVIKDHGAERYEVDFINKEAK